MKFLGYPLYLCFTLILASAQSSTGDAVDTLPACASQCLNTAVTASVCSPSDQTCICADAVLQKEVEGCVLSNCTQKQALTTMNITSTACGVPVRDRGARFNAFSISFGAMTAFIVFIRMVRYYLSSGSNLGWDDLFIVITLAVGITGSVINSVALVPNGLGRDVWRVSFDELTAFIKWLYLQEVLYFAQISLLKISILFFYFRIFGKSNIRIPILVTLVFNALCGIIFVFVGTFQCNPIEYNWNKWHGEAKGQCLNINGIAWANASVSIALDFWMLTLPLSQIRSLNMHWKKKVGVAMMFCVGLFVTIVSILRLQTLVQFANTHNPTWDQYDVVNWSTIEINVGIICACMPALRFIMGQFFPRILGSTRHTYGNSAGQSGRSTRGNRGATGTQKSAHESVVKTHDGESSTITGLARGGVVGSIHSRDNTVDYHDEIRLVNLSDWK
ncbi:Satratoxin biosynthesis SC1 cluster protein [Paramyrothecium foliicola]|nr:Satratoxin biosynthesis SC1 cluster protein [Paramyrothecium foliicola]